MTRAAGTKADINTLALGSTISICRTRFRHETKRTKARGDIIDLRAAHRPYLELRNGP